MMAGTNKNASLIFGWHRESYSQLFHSLLLAWVVSATGAYHQFAMMRSLSFNLYGAISACALRRCRLVSDGVLVADVMCDFAGNRVNFLEILREEGHAAGVFGHGLQG